MSNSVSSQFSRYVTDVYELQEKFQGISSIKDLPILQKMQKLAAKLQDIGSLFAESKDIDESEQELTLDTLGIVMSIEGELASRIEVLLQTAQPAPPPLSTSLEILGAMACALSSERDPSEIKALYDHLPPKTQEKICENLWRVMRSLGPKCTVSAQDFGRESLFGTEPRYVLSPLQKRLAVELCMTPSVILEKGMHLIYSGEESKLLDLFNLIPKKIQERVFRKLWESMERTTPYAGYNGSDDFSKAIKDKKIRIDIKIGIFLELNEAVTQSERDVNSLVERAQNEFLAIDDLYPEISLPYISMTKNLLVHDVARDLLEILDSEAFIGSTKDSLQEILADYHVRYPALLHSRILFIFHPMAFRADVEPLVDNKKFATREPSMVATATASAASRALGGSITVRGGGGGTFRDVLIDGTFMMMPPPPVIEQSLVEQGAAGTGECPDSKKVLTAGLDPSWVVVGRSLNPTRRSKRGDSSPFRPLFGATALKYSRRIGETFPWDSNIARGSTNLQCSVPNTGSSVQPVAQAPIVPGSAGTGESPTMKRSKRVISALDAADAGGAVLPATRVHEIAPSIDDALRMLRIPHRDSMIAINPEILRSCPEELRQLVAQAVIIDWKATSFIASQTLFSVELPTYHIDRVLWGLESHIEELQKFIGTLERNYKARVIRDVIEILKVKEKNLSDTYRNLLNYALARTLHSDDEVFGRLPHRLYERALLLSRLNLHLENVKYLRSKNPISGMILKLQEKMRDLEKWLAEIPSCTSQIELLQEDLFIEVYQNNLLLANFWLHGLTIHRLMETSGTYERDALARYLHEDISRIERVIKEAKSHVLPMHQGDKKEAFNREIYTLEEQLSQAKKISDQIMRISILGLRDSNGNLFNVIFSSSIDKNLAEAIKHQCFEIAQKTEQSCLESLSVFPASYDAAQVCLYEILASMRTS
ncbi:MAG: hypothetical protein NTX49_00615 [Chlamydiae bacterium]|nr:hypothetical protein [Chlamydiota bacterium]